MKQYKYYVEFNKGEKQECTMEQIMKYVYIENIEPIIKEATRNGVGFALVPTNPFCEVHNLIKEVTIHIEY